MIKILTSVHFDLKCCFILFFDKKHEIIYTWNPKEKMFLKEFSNLNDLSNFVLTVDVYI